MRSTTSLHIAIFRNLAMTVWFWVQNNTRGDTPCLANCIRPRCWAIDYLHIRWEHSIDLANVQQIQSCSPTCRLGIKLNLIIWTQAGYCQWLDRKFCNFYEEFIACLTVPLSDAESSTATTSSCLCLAAHPHFGAKRGADMDGSESGKYQLKSESFVRQLCVSNRSPGRCTSRYSQVFGII